VSTDVLLPLIVSIGLGFLLLLLLWRVFVVGGELRRDAQQGRAALDIARRAETSLRELSAIVDELRRGKAGPEASGASLRASAEALRRYAEEAEVVDGHVPHADGAGLRAEIERAQRAVDLIEHGRGLLLDSEGEHVSEGETSIKRGYLNLLHARDAIRTRAEEIAAAVAAPARDKSRPRGR
jgi:hypothetical protein